MNWGKKVLGLPLDVARSERAYRHHIRLCSVRRNGQEFANNGIKRVRPHRLVEPRYAVKLGLFTLAPAIVAGENRKRNAPCFQFSGKLRTIAIGQHIVDKCQGRRMVRQTRDRSTTRSMRPNNTEASIDQMIFDHHPNEGLVLGNEAETRS